MRVIPLDRLTDSQFEASLRARRGFDAEVNPDLPEITPEEWRGLMAVKSFNDEDQMRFGACLDDDRMVALGHLGLKRSPENRDKASCEIDGIPQAGESLLRVICDTAEEAGRTSLMAWGRLIDEQKQFWESHAMPHVYVERLSDLDVSAVEPQLMESWIDQRHDRAGDIELVRWSGGTPDEWMPQMLEALDAMNDAPRDELDAADSKSTPEKLRRQEAAFQAIGEELEVLLAVDAAKQVAGMTMLGINTHRPAASWQADTVVLSAFRNRGIGRWLKAEMWSDLRETRPEVTRLRTGNAESNDAMLAINVAMGYRPAHNYGIWQADLREVQATLQPDR